MNLFISKIVSSILEIIIFSLVPFIVWLIRARKETGFLNWIGLKKIRSAERKQIIWGILGIEVAFLVLSVFMLFSLRGVETAASDFAGLGAGALGAILVYAIFNTALPEEILFRGFLLKRLSGRCGFWSAAVFQAVIFGIIHGGMFFSLVGFGKAFIITVFTGAIGLAIGILNEKAADGSILPGICIHALANIFSGICSAFMLF